MQPKVLVISNTEFNLSDSNGRFLGTLLRGIDNEHKMQFCINGTSVSSNLIKSSYRISDKTVVRCFVKKRVPAVKLPIDIPPEASKGIISNRKIKRNAASMLVRDFLWKISIPRTDFISLAKEFKPDIVLWQYGDSGFMSELTRRIANECNAKIVVYTTEDYYFKTWDYFSKRGRTLTYTLFSTEMRRSVRKLFKESSLCIANTPFLAERFENEFGCRTEVVMPSASDNLNQAEEPIRRKRIVYAGNLGINRHLSVIEIARALYEIDPSVVFEVYGRAEEKIWAELKEEPNIRMMGFVSYWEITEIVRTSLLTVHTESFEEFYRYDLEAAFSTKITDALISGTPLFMYAPGNLAETQYLKKNRCAFVCTEKQQLSSSLREALNDEKLRNSIIESGKEVVERNHNSIINQRRIYNLLLSVCEE